MEKEFRVVSIPNRDSVVVNAGATNLGVGTILEIFIPGKEIFDPETNKSLGTLDIIKAYLEVVAVYPAMCLCKNRVKHNVLTTLGGLVEPVRESLEIDLKDLTGELMISEEDKKIRIGDKVRISVG